MEVLGPLFLLCFFFFSKKSFEQEVEARALKFVAGCVSLSLSLSPCLLRKLCAGVWNTELFDFLLMLLERNRERQSFLTFFVCAAVSAREGKRGFWEFLGFTVGVCRHLSCIVLCTIFH